MLNKNTTITNNIKKTFISITQQYNQTQIGGGPLAPSSALPIGAESTIDPIRLVETVPTSDLLHSIIGKKESQTYTKHFTNNNHDKQHSCFTRKIR